MAEFESIEFSVEDGIARLVLSRRPVNIINIRMLREMNAALASLKKDTEVKCLVVQAEGYSFSEGLDISELTPGRVAELRETYHYYFQLLDNLECPTLSLVKGAALGGGCEVALASDLVFASDKARFAQPEVKLGLFAPVAAAGFPKFANLKSVYEMLLLGEEFPADEAFQAGLINRVWPHDEFDQRADELLEKLRALSSVGLQMTRRALKAGLVFSFSDALMKIGRIYLNELMATHDANEGIQAFMENRPPNWKNR